MRFRRVSLFLQNLHNFTQKEMPGSAPTWPDKTSPPHLYSGQNPARSRSGESHLSNAKGGAPGTTLRFHSSPAGGVCYGDVTPTIAALVDANATVVGKVRSRFPALPTAP